MSTNNTTWDNLTNSQSMSEFFRLSPPRGNAGKTIRDYATFAASEFEVSEFEAQQVLERDCQRALGLGWDKKTNATAAKLAAENE